MVEHARSQAALLIVGLGGRRAKHCVRLAAARLAVGEDGRVVAVEALLRQRPADRVEDGLLCRVLAADEIKREDAVLLWRVQLELAASRVGGENALAFGIIAHADVDGDVLAAVHFGDGQCGR